LSQTFRNLYLKRFTSFHSEGVLIVSSMGPMQTNNGSKAHCLTFWAFIGLHTFSVLLRN